MITKQYIDDFFHNFVVVIARCVYAIERVLELFQISVYW